MPERTDEDPEPAKRAKPLPERKFKSSRQHHSRTRDVGVPARPIRVYGVVLRLRQSDAGWNDRGDDQQLPPGSYRPKVEGWVESASKSRAPCAPRHNLLKSDRRIHLSDYRKEIADAGEMLVNTIDELVDLPMAYQKALDYYAMRQAKRGA